MNSPEHLPAKKGGACPQEFREEAVRYWGSGVPPGPCQRELSFLCLLLEQEKIVQSMSRKGNRYDNALGETFWATIKTECFDNFRTGIPRPKPRPGRLCLDTSNCFIIDSECIRLSITDHLSSLSKMDKPMLH